MSGGPWAAVGEALYGAAVRWRERRRQPPARLAGARVVSVGNLEAGGAGKTPCTLWWAGELSARGVAAAVVCRPWGPPAGEHASDEVALYAERLPAGVRLECDRVKRRAAERAAAAGARVVVVDDGFSHRGLHRDLDLVLLDCRRPFGNGHLLPRGRLREPPESLRRADAVALTRADRADADTRRAARAAVRASGFAGPVLYARHRIVGLRDGDAVRPPAGERVWCASGLGRPTELAEAAAAAGLEVAGERRFADHHRFGAGQWRDLVARARAADARVLVSAKDAVRLQPSDRREALVLEVEWQWIDGEVEPAWLVERALGA